jgi:mannose-1-phosphate guanylyltransferase/mannose-6-phosphate isomerase
MYKNKIINAVPVILCGGSGSRLWPLSRNGFPKQFLALAGNESLFQQTVMRALKIDGQDIAITRPVIVTNEEHRFLAVEQLREINSQASFILEPVGKNTAPALTMASLFVKETYSEKAIMFVMPSDQNITNEEQWVQAIRRSIMQAQEGGIVTLGVTPTHPETGYGYIQKQGIKNNHHAFEVKQFTEKPKKEIARQYFDSQNYFWNSGIFILQADSWLASMQKFRPEILHQTQLSWETKATDSGGYAEFIRPNKDIFNQVPNDSIDYAVIEKCPGRAPIYVVPLDAGWSDLGAWNAVWNVGQKDLNNNVTHGDVLMYETSNSYIHATGKLIGAVGLKDIVVIETSDAILVADKNNSQSVKEIVEQLEKLKREEKNLHRKVHRPWGWYDSLDEGENFKVKRIQVKPKASLSLQMHHHRAEHWIIVKGTAEITNGAQISTLSENQSTFIPLGQKHRLRNPGEIPLEIIEVQSGAYLGEDDIVRFSDAYGR